MDKLFRNWIVVVSIGSFLGIILLVAGLTIILKNKSSVSLQDITICCAAGLVMAVCIYHWLKILRTKTLFSKNQVISLNGGEIVVPVPISTFELWIFCRVPFAQYHGCLSIDVDGGSECAIKVPRRNPFLYPVRSNLMPIIWRLPYDGSGLREKCRVKFHLSPSFEETAYDRRVDKSNRELVSILVKVNR